MHNEATSIDMRDADALKKGMEDPALEFTK